MLFALKHASAAFKLVLAELKQEVVPVTQAEGCLTRYVTPGLAVVWCVTSVHSGAHAGWSSYSGAIFLPARSRLAPCSGPGSGAPRPSPSLILLPYEPPLPHSAPSVCTQMGVQHMPEVTLPETEGMITSSAPTLKAPPTPFSVEKNFRRPCSELIPPIELAACSKALVSSTDSKASPILPPNGVKKLRSKLTSNGTGAGRSTSPSKLSKLAKPASAETS